MRLAGISLLLTALLILSPGCGSSNNNGKSRKQAKANTPEQTKAKTTQNNSDPKKPGSKNPQPQDEGKRRFANDPGKNVRDAWAAAGAQTAWFRLDERGLMSSHGFGPGTSDDYVAKNVRPDETPGFTFEMPSTKPLHKLPETNLAYGIHLGSMAYIAEALPQLGQLKNLKILDLSGCEVTDEQLKGLSGAPKLLGVSLQHCKKLKGLGFKHLTKCPSLEVMTLRFCRNLTPKGFEALGTVNTLKTLNLGATPLDDTGLKHVAKLKNLRRLYIGRETKITDAGVKHLAKLTNLEHLGLGGAGKVTDDGVKSLTKIESLKELDLRGTKVTGAGLKGLANHKNLEVLDIRGCFDLKDADLQHLQKFKSLKTVKVAPFRGITKGGIDKLQKSVPKLKVDQKLG